LNVPDRARGKKIRCPHCETPLSVPAGQQTKRTARSKAAARPAADEEDVLADLDLSRAVDESVPICPRCGTEVEETDLQCPNCFVDLGTGVVSDKTKRLMSRRGPPAARYYAESIKDSWRFLLENKKLALRTTNYGVIFSGIAIICAFMVFWCATLPPKCFWALVGFVCTVTPLGWLWFLNGEIIRETLRRKKKLKRVNFDFFLTSAFGIKLLLWIVIYPLPAVLIMGLIAVVFFVLEMPIVAASLLGFGYVLGLITAPIAMAHMSMPVTQRGWLSPLTLRTFFNNPGQTLFWCLIFLVTIGPIGALLAGNAVFFQKDIGTVLGAVRMNTRIAQAEDWVGEKGDRMPKEIADLKAADRRQVPWMSVILPFGISAAGFALLGPPAVFNMRMTGLYALYCREELDLVTEVKKPEYVPPKLDDHGKPILPGLSYKLLSVLLLASIVVGIAGAFGLRSVGLMLTVRGMDAMGPEAAFVGTIILITIPTFVLLRKLSS
jgi:hypothetical protein